MATLVATCLLGLAALIRQQLQRLGLEIQDKDLGIMSTALREGLHYAAHEHRDMPEDTNEQRSVKHRLLHETAIEHAKGQAGKVAKKFTGDQLGRMLKAGLAFAKGRI